MSTQRSSGLGQWAAFVLAAVAIAAGSILVTGQITIPNTFVNGTVADAPQVNANFTALGSTALNRTGGTMTGLLDISNAAAGQIKFPATQNASANANTLDDYVEGTFTATLTGATVAVTVTARYTKVGNVVTLEMGEFAGGSATSFTSNATSKTMTGLPAVLAPTTSKSFIVSCSDNGTAFQGCRSTLVSQTINVFVGLDAGNWTAAGTGQIKGWTLAYTLQ